MQSLNIFMHELLDYAGLFPPTTLSLHDSLKNFAEYHYHSQKNWLGKFILPVNKIDDLILILSKQNIFSGIEKKASFSVILSSCESISDFPNYLQKDLNSITNLINQFKDIIDIQSFELLPPKEVFSSSSSKLMNEFLLILSDKFSLFQRITEFYCELPFLENMEDYLASIIKNNLNNGSHKMSVKLRTGGITPQQIPSAQDIAKAIFLCAEQKIPIKATAGLHVPVPNDNPHIGARLHGFLNVFSCMLLCYDQLFNRKEMEKIILSYSYLDFKFSVTGLHVGDRFISNQKMNDLRKNFIKSFGTCSFLEPVEHLHENHFIS